MHSETETHVLFWEICSCFYSGRYACAIAQIWLVLMGLHVDIMKIPVRFKFWENFVVYGIHNAYNVMYCLIEPSNEFFQKK